MRHIRLMLRPSRLAGRCVPPRPGPQLPHTILAPRHLHTSTRSSNAEPPLPHTRLPVDGAADISHSHFISSASPSSDFNPTQQPSAGLEASHKWEGRLSPTTSHLFKLILPLPTWRADPTGAKTDGQVEPAPQPTAFLLHPSQPLSHLSRLIAGSLPPERRDVEIRYLALTGPENELDAHLRNAEEEASETEDEDGARALEGDSGGATRQEGGPYLREREKDRGKLQEVSWSQSTDLSDFIKQSCLDERFKIAIKPRAKEGKEGKGIQVEAREMVLEVKIPSFESRTRYLRRRLLDLTRELDGMTKQKKQIDIEAHKGARKLIVAGLIAGAGYWVAVVRWTFFTDAGWDVMEPVTWAVGFGGLLASAAFLAYHNREVSYSSILDLSVTARQQALYGKHGLDIERWTEMVAEAKGIRREIIRIAADYDIEWKGELENLARMARRHGAIGGRRGTASAGDKPGEGEAGEEGGEEEPAEKIDIDKTIDEADELASHSKEQKEKEKAAQRKGEAVPGREEGGGGPIGRDDEVGKEEKSSVRAGEKKARQLAKK